MADLPTLPDPTTVIIDHVSGRRQSQGLFTADQMRAYGTACAEHAERATAARCAEIAEGWATDETAATCANVADAIRRHYGLRERADGR